MHARIWTVLLGFLVLAVPRLAAQGATGTITGRILN